MSGMVAGLFGLVALVLLVGLLHARGYHLDRVAWVFFAVGCVGMVLVAVLFR
jgi:hypothetical protein